MKIKTALALLALWMMSALVWSGTATAQEEAEEQGNAFLVATFYVNVPEDGSIEEVQEMLAGRGRTQSLADQISQLF